MAKEQIKITGILISLLLILANGCNNQVATNEEPVIKQPIEQEISAKKVVDEPAEEFEIEEWEELNAEELKDIENVFNCAEQSGVDMGDYLTKLMECSFGECFTIEDEKEADICVDECADTKTFEKRAENLNYNIKFRICIEEIKEIIELEEKIEQEIIVKEGNEVVEEPQSKQIQIDCSYDKYNCGDFNIHAEAQAVFEACSSDIHRLDGDNDGIACEGLK